MRPIIVSTDVFAALWARRQPGEDSENAVLERLLGLPKGPPLPAFPVTRPAREMQRPADGGIYNQMFGVHFPPDFTIFRTYKGKSYSATVREGRWVMDGVSYPSLFALSMAIADSQENPWVHWKYRDPKGRVDVIRALRKPPPEPEEPSAARKTAKTRAKKK